MIVVGVVVLPLHKIVEEEYICLDKRLACSLVFKTMHDKIRRFNGISNLKTYLAKPVFERFR